MRALRHRVGALDGDLPGRPCGVAAARADFAAGLDHVVGDAQRLERARRPVDTETLGDAGRSARTSGAHLGDGARVRVERELAPADARFERADFGCADARGASCPGRSPMRRRAGDGDVECAARWRRSPSGPARTRQRRRRRAKGVRRAWRLNRDSSESGRYVDIFATTASSAPATASRAAAARRRRQSGPGDLDRVGRAHRQSAELEHAAATAPPGRVAATRDQRGGTERPQHRAPRGESRVSMRMLHSVVAHHRGLHRRRAQPLRSALRRAR